MKATLKQIRTSVIVITLMFICTFAGYWLGLREIDRIKPEGLPDSKYKVINTAVPKEKTIDFSLFWEVWDKLEERYFDKTKINEEKMVYGAIQGMTASLGDPYTVFLPPSENKKVKEDLNGEFEGVGIRLGFNDDGRLTVIAPLKGSPAEKAGARSGDVILHIKDDLKDIDEDTLGLSLPKAVEKIRGPRGTEIILTLLHTGEGESVEVSIKRATINVPSVEVEFIGEDKSIVHLRLTRFGDKTFTEWDKVVVEIREHCQLNQADSEGSCLGLLLDTRGNPGGYLRGAVNLASEFLSKGVVMKQENYDGLIETYSVNRRGKLLGIPMLVLIDKGSASASEILAAALRENGRAKLVGSTSFGKGTIQETEELDGDMGLHITAARWLTPQGSWVNETKGLEPDYEIEEDYDTKDKDEQLEGAIELLKNAN